MAPDNLLHWNICGYLSVKGHCKTPRLNVFLQYDCRHLQVKWRIKRLIQQYFTNFCLEKWPSTSSNSELNLWSKHREKLLWFIAFPFWKQQETNLIIILQIHKHTKSVSGRLGDRFIEEIHSKIISFLRHELYYKRDLQYYTKDVFKAVNSSCNVFHVCKPPAELQQMGWNHHTGKLSDTLSRQAHRLRVGFQLEFEISGQPSRWACTLG